MLSDGWRGAERVFMKRRGTKGGASFADIAATLDAKVVLHQSPDLPFGGEYFGHERYREWADAMSAIFREVNAQDPVFFENGDFIVIFCTLVPCVRATGEVIGLPMLQIVSC